METVCIRPEQEADQRSSAFAWLCLAAGQCPHQQSDRYWEFFFKKLYLQICKLTEINDDIYIIDIYVYIYIYFFFFYSK